MLLNSTIQEIKYHNIGFYLAVYSQVENAEMLLHKKDATAICTLQYCKTPSNLSCLRNLREKCSYNKCSSGYGSGVN